jgi:hypothetical protein
MSQSQKGERSTPPTCARDGKSISKIFSVAEPFQLCFLLSQGRTASLERMTIDRILHRKRIAFFFSFYTLGVAQLDDGHDSL